MKRMAVFLCFNQLLAQRRGRGVRLGGDPLTHSMGYTEHHLCAWPAAGWCRGHAVTVTAPGPALAGLTGQRGDRVQTSDWVTRSVPAVIGALKGVHRMAGGTEVSE